MASSNRRLSRTDYHVAWICSVANLELMPARLMLDEEHLTPLYDTHYDENSYICGSISGHTIVIATCPQGETGNVNAGRLTGSLFKTFSQIRTAVLVGIGGGVPHLDNLEGPLNDVHLGDVVVGWPGDGKPACVYHDRGRSGVGGQFEVVGTMQNPDWRIINALSILASDYEMGRTTFDDQLMRLRRSETKERFEHPGLEHDRLFKATYHHIGDYRSKCVACDKNEVVQRAQRSEDSKHKLVFHQGRIATGNAVIQDGRIRDVISARCDGVLCVEMEAAGVNVNRPCLVIRGISDYADSHKNDMWRFYAAGNAAAFTRALLCRMTSLPITHNVDLRPRNHTETVGSRGGSTSRISAPRNIKNRNNSTRKGPKSGKVWSRAEDEKLLSVVKTMEKPDWTFVAQHFDRGDWACQKRYEKLMERWHGS